MTSSTTTTRVASRALPAFRSDLDRDERHGAFCADRHHAAGRRGLDSLRRDVRLDLGEALLHSLRLLHEVAGIAEHAFVGHPRPYPCPTIISRPRLPAPAGRGCAALPSPRPRRPRGPPERADWRGPHREDGALSSLRAPVEAARPSARPFRSPVTQRARADPDRPAPSTPPRPPAGSFPAASSSGRSRPPRESRPSPHRPPHPPVPTLRGMRRRWAARQESVRPPLPNPDSPTPALRVSPASTRGPAAVVRRVAPRRDLARPPWTVVRPAERLWAEGGRL